MEPRQMRVVEFFFLSYFRVTPLVSLAHWRLVNGSMFLVS